MSRTGSSRRRGMPRTTVLAAFTIGAAALASAACYEDPQERMDQMQLAVDMEDAVNALGAQTSELLFTVDSLRRVVARQDTAIARLANLAGVPY